jgi:hypothetical protein
VAVTAVRLCRYGQLLSSEPLRVNFHPSSLLSIGDLLAFVRELQAAAAAAADGPTAAGAGAALAHDRHASAAHLLDEAQLQLPGCPDAALQQQQQQHAPQLLRNMGAPLRALAYAEAPPSIEEQMALSDGLTSRIPQRYLIQNLTGSHLWYWAGDDEVAAPQSRVHTKRRLHLPAYAMQELKVGVRCVRHVCVCVFAALCVCGSVDMRALAAQRALSLVCTLLPRPWPRLQVSPVPRRVRHLAADGSLVAAGAANTITIQLAGNWLPVEDVSGGCWMSLLRASCRAGLVVCTHQACGVTLGPVG